LTLRREWEIRTLRSDFSDGFTIIVFDPFRFDLVDFSFCLLK